MGEQFVLRLSDSAGIAGDVADRYVRVGSFGWQFTTALDQAELFTRDRGEAFMDQGGLLVGCELVPVALMDAGPMIIEPINVLRDRPIYVQFVTLGGTGYGVTCYTALAILNAVAKSNQADSVRVRPQPFPVQR